LRVLKLGDVLPQLRRALKGIRGLRLAYLFGSLAEGASTHDIDIAFLAEEEGKLRVISELVARISRALGVPEDKIDLLDLETADIVLLHRVMRQGIKLIGDEGLERELKARLERDHLSLEEELREITRRWFEEDPALDAVLLGRRLDEVLRDANLLKRYVEGGLTWVLSDLERTYAFERALHRALEAMLDICRHVVSAKELGAVEFYSEYPLRLAEVGLMDRGLAEKLAEMARLRNVLVHRYVELDHTLLMEAAAQLVDEIVPKLGSWLRELLRQEKRGKT